MKAKVTKSRNDCCPRSDELFAFDFYDWKLPFAISCLVSKTCVSLFIKILVFNIFQMVFPGVFLLLFFFWLFSLGFYGIFLLLSGIQSKGSVNILFSSFFFFFLAISTQKKKLFLSFFFSLCLLSSICIYLFFLFICLEYASRRLFSLVTFSLWIQWEYYREIYSFKKRIKSKRDGNEFKSNIKIECRN